MMSILEYAEQTPSSHEQTLPVCARGRRGEEADCLFIYFVAAGEEGEGSVGEDRHTPPPTHTLFLSI